MTYKIKTPARLRSLRRDSAQEGLETAETRYPGHAHNDTAQNGTAQNTTAHVTAQDEKERNSSTPVATEATSTTTTPSLAVQTTSSSIDNHFRSPDSNVPPVQRLPLHEFGRKLRARATTVPSNALQDNGSASARSTERPARPLTDLEAETHDNMDVTFTRPFTETNKPVRPHGIHHVMMVRRGDARVQVEATDTSRRQTNASQVHVDNLQGGHVELDDEKKQKKPEEISVEKPKSYLKVREDPVVEGNATKSRSNRTSTGFTLMHRTREQIVGAKKSQSLTKSRHDAPMVVTQRVRNASDMVANLTFERQAENAIVKHSRGNLTYKSSLLLARRNQKAVLPVIELHEEVGTKLAERMEAMPSSHSARTTPTTTSSERPTTKMADFREPSTKMADFREPSTKMADFREPSTKMADFREPSTKMADFREPSTKMADFREPSTKMADFREPSTKMADFREPSTKMADFREPSTKMADFREPSTKMADFREPTTKMADFRQPTSKILSTAVVTSISVLGDWTPIVDHDPVKTLNVSNVDPIDNDDLNKPSSEQNVDLVKMPRQVDVKELPKTKETFEVTYSKTLPGSSANIPMSDMSTTTERNVPRTTTTQETTKKTEATVSATFRRASSTEEPVRWTPSTTKASSTPSPIADSVKKSVTTEEPVRWTPSTTTESVRRTPPTTKASSTPSPIAESVKKTVTTEEPVRWTPSTSTEGVRRTPPTTKATTTPSSTAESVKKTVTEEPVRWTPSSTTESVRRTPPTTTEEVVRWSPSTSERNVPKTASTSEKTPSAKLPKTEASTESVYTLDGIPDEVQLNLRDGISTRRPGVVKSTTLRYAQNHRPAHDHVAVPVHQGEDSLDVVRRVIEDSVNQTLQSHGKVRGVHVDFGVEDEVRRRPKEGDAGVGDDGDVSNYVLASFGVVPIVVGVLLAARFLISRRKKIWESEKSPLTFVSTNEWEFPRSKLRLQTVLGEGNFGLVYKAEADDILGERATRLVAVKTVKDNASSREKEDLARELTILKQIGSHSNVVTLLGCCTEKEPSLLILEYVMYGKLLSFLRDHRTRKQYFNFSEETAELTAKDLTSFAYCVARGMEYLATKGVIHRDLAARNILVDHNKVCKVADFGMSRSISEPDQIYEQAPAKGALPIRWMAPESLLQRIFTHKSDVWAFGILMWEIVTLGSTPYQNLSAREVIREVREGHRLARPPHCRAELYRVAATCWAHDPVQRPSFAEIKQQLGSLLEQGETQAYVDLDSYIDSIAGGRAITQHTTQVVNL